MDILDLANGIRKDIKVKFSIDLDIEVNIVGE
jgi:UDP-N-acetylenolpyruvoylglucosamine reductase